MPADWQIATERPPEDARRYARLEWGPTLVNRRYNPRDFRLVPVIRTKAVASCFCSD